MIRIQMDETRSDYGEPIDDLPHPDRRIERRRVEDYFWLNRLGQMSDNALMVFNRDLSLEFANDLTLSLFDITRDDFTRLKSYDDFIDHCVVRGDFGRGTETTLKAFSEDLKRNARINSAKQLTHHQISTPSGKRLCLRQSFGPDDRMLVLIRDITEQYESEKALELAMQIAAAGYVTYNIETGDWKISGANMEHYFGPNYLNDFKARGLECFMHPNDVPMAQQAWANCVEKKVNVDIRVRMITADGKSVWFRNYGVPRTSEDGKVISVLCYFVDISQEMKLQEEQRLAMEKTQAALKAKNNFLARLSHEVRTPMNAVIGISDALIHHHSDPAITPKLELIQNSAEKIIRIVDETLDHTKMEEDQISLDLTPTDPAKCVDTVCRLWQEKATENNVNLTCRIDPDLPQEIMMDGYRYEQCVNNLLSNAVKFTPGGMVSVVLTKLSKAGLQDQLVLVVKDNGIGMTPEQQVNIFTPYKQADNTIFKRFGGTGLGMSITKKIIENMGGSIKIKSAEGEGTAFIIAIPYGDIPSTNLSQPQLHSAHPSPAFVPPQSPMASSPPVQAAATVQPIATQPVVPAQSAPVSSAVTHEQSQPEQITAPTTQIQPPSLTPVSPVKAEADNFSLVDDMLMDTAPQSKETVYSNLRVLVVDDNETNHLVVKSLLESVVGSIITANNGKQAIECLQSQEVDLVLMDIHMPIMDGIEATLSIRGSNTPFANIPIIALTADPQYQQKRLCKNIGMDEALAKPVKLTEILEAVDNILERIAQNNQDPTRLTQRSA